MPQQASTSRDGGAVGTGPKQGGISIKMEMCLAEHAVPIRGFGPQFLHQSGVLGPASLGPCCSSWGNTPSNATLLSSMNEAKLGSRASRADATEGLRTGSHECKDFGGLIGLEPLIFDQ